MKKIEELNLREMLLFYAVIFVWVYLPFWKKKKEEGG